MSVIRSPRTHTVCTKLTSEGDFANSLQGDPVPMPGLKKKKRQASHGKPTPAGLRQEAKANLCVKSGCFDP